MNCAYCTLSGAALCVALLLPVSGGCDVDPQDEEMSTTTRGVDSEDASMPFPSGDSNANPFRNDPAQAFGALSGMGYVCFDQDDTRYNLLFSGSAVTLRLDDETTSEGTYTTDGASLSLTFPEVGLTEVASQPVFALDALVYFEVASTQCAAFALDYRAQGGTESVDCPTIKYVPEVSWEKNQFHFGPGGDLLRRSWTELPMVPDTLYSSRAGVYRYVADQVYMVLPFADEGEEWLTGTVAGDGLYIDQLEPEQGACQ